MRALGTRDRLRPLLDQVLDALVLWTGVERGLLLLRAPDGRLVPRAARNLARQICTGEQLALSRSLAERALAHAASRWSPSTPRASCQRSHASVHALKLRSVLAVPLVARGEALGVVYLDDRVRRGAFGPGELAWVRLVAALAAVAIADARDQLASAGPHAAPSAPKRASANELAAPRGARSTWPSASSRARAESRRPASSTTTSSARARRCAPCSRSSIASPRPRSRAGRRASPGSGKELVARAHPRERPRAARRRS